MNRRQGWDERLALIGAFHDRFLGEDWLSDAALSRNLETVSLPSGRLGHQTVAVVDGSIEIRAVTGRGASQVEWLLAHGADPDAGSEEEALHRCGRSGERAARRLRIATSRGAAQNLCVFPPRRSTVWRGHLAHGSSLHPSDRGALQVLLMGADIHARARHRHAKAAAICGGAWCRTSSLRLR